MKHLITMTASLMILMALLSQFVQNQSLLMQLEAGSHAVDIFCEKQDEDDLKVSLSRIMDCVTAEIVIEKEEGFVVVTAPVKSILATPGVWGIEPEENRGIYRWEREVQDG